MKATTVNTVAAIKKPDKQEQQQIQDNIYLQLVQIKPTMNISGKQIRKGKTTNSGNSQPKPERAPNKNKYSKCMLNSRITMYVIIYWDKGGKLNY